VSEPSTEASLAAALAPFGWTCGPEFWQRYYSDPWVFNLANAVERLAASESARERAEGDLAALQAACDAAVSDAATARAEAERLRAAVLTLHAKRTHTVDGYTLQWCVECQQDWPCPTAAALSPSTDDTEDTSDGK
jgi:hypothetical protein